MKTKSRRCPASSNPNRAKTAAGEQRILLQTPEWRQEAPFNNMIPGKPLAGCVGTAMATIMRYHSFPERGTGSYNGVNFDVAYDWSNMRMDNYRSGYTQAEADAVATLIYHAGVSIGTQFGYSGSSAYEVKVPAALVNYFNYDPRVSYKKRSEVKTQAEFDRIVETEIRASRPVLYCGQDVTSGHAFVVDGYDPMSGMLHINWGWGGASGNNNGGWYVSTALNPTVSQSHSFNNLTTIIYNIKPGNGDNAAWSPLHITANGRQCGMSSDLEGNLTAGNAFTVRVGNIKNVSYSNFGGKIAVALFGADGTFKTTLCTPVGFHLNAMTIFGSAYADFQCTLPEDATVEDGDVIRMATLADGADTWLPVPGELPTTNEIPAKGATPGYFTVGHTTPLADATFTGEDRVIRGWNYRFRVVPANPDRDVVTVRNNGCVLTRFPADKDIDITKAASFLKDNIGLETIERKLYIARKSEVTENRPEGIDAFAAGAKVKVYDNGVLLADDAIAADGSITLTYHNPNKHLDKSGNHKVEVVYLYDINFNCASDNLKALGEDGSHLTSVEVREGMPIKFRIEMADTQSSELTSVVKINDVVLPSGDDGYYTIDAADSDLDIYVYTVPRNGATLSPDNIAMINAAEASGVTNISFAGEIDDETLVNVISQLPEIEEINFSGLTSPLPVNAVAGKETVKTVVLPQADAIEDGTFSGCSALESVAVPATVNSIGSRAFEGCASLTSLSFTGISGVGAHAFADCDNLTSIIFNTSHAGSEPAARVKSAAPRNTGYSPDAFAGLNPNCIIYLDENETIATGTPANFVKVRTVEDGVNKYRVYESLGDISIDPAYSFSALNPITLPEGREVNLELELCKTNGLSAWSPIVLPFAPTAVSDAEGNPMTLHSGKETAFTGKDYAVATLAEGASDLTLASAIEANRPYLVGTCGNTEGGKVKFSAQNGTVAQTPDEIVSNGSDYTLHATYESRSLDAATTYMLDAEGSSFAAIGAAPLEATDADNDARADISPFSVYAEAPADHGSININIPISDYVTGVDHVGDDRTGLRIERRGDTLVIYSDKACEIKVFGIDGILVKVLHLSAGANTVAGLRPGNYIMNGVKTAF